jgi:putative PIN family toxin of toxin-antitoxin system
VLRVTADTNILLSGVIFPKGKPFQLMELAREGKINLNISADILAEVEDVLRRKFGFSPGEMAETTARLKAIARTVTPSVQVHIIKEDPDDNRILECAVSAGADYIVTGDKDLLRLGRYDAIAIVTVADFLEQQRHTW